MTVPMSKRRTLQELTPNPVELRRCRNCENDLSEAHYSMILTNLRGRFTSGHAKLICNGCLTKTGTGYFRNSTAWQTRKACKAVDAEVFFPETEEDVKERAWRWVCDDCPVRLECLDFGTHTKATGVYGGVYLAEGIEVREITDRAEMRGRIAELYQMGYSGRVIGESLGISMNKVFRELDKMQIPRHPRK